MGEQRESSDWKRYCTEVSYPGRLRPAKPEPAGPCTPQPHATSPTAMLLPSLGPSAGKHLAKQEQGKLEGVVPSAHSDPGASPGWQVVAG